MPILMQWCSESPLPWINMGGTVTVLHSYIHDICNRHNITAGWMITTHLLSRKTKLKMRKTIVMMIPQVARKQNITVTAMCTVTVSPSGTPSPPAGRQEREKVNCVPESALDNQGFRVPEKLQELFPQLVCRERERLWICWGYIPSSVYNISYEERDGEKKTVERNFC